MLEIGFNGGHSATLALIANPKLDYHAIDLCEHNYTRRCFQLLRFRFPGRVTLTCGDSTVSLRELEFERWAPRWRHSVGQRVSGTTLRIATGARGGKAHGRGTDSFDDRGYDFLHVDGGHAGK
eukprot:6986830-Prymnesium_polylepis.1